MIVIQENQVNHLNLLLIINYLLILTNKNQLINKLKKNYYFLLWLILEELENFLKILISNHLVLMNINFYKILFFCMIS